MDTTAWFLITFWLKLLLLPIGLAPLVFRDGFKSAWFQKALHKIHSLDFSMENYVLRSFDDARTALKQQLWDIDLKQIQARCHPNIYYILAKMVCCSLLFIIHYDSEILSGLHFSRLGALPSTVLFGSFKGTPVYLQLCPCGDGSIETHFTMLLLI